MQVNRVEPTAFCQGREGGRARGLLLELRNGERVILSRVSSLVDVSLGFSDYPTQPLAVLPASATDPNRNLMAVRRRTLTCQICRGDYPIDYFGRRPPYAPAYTFLEDAYLLRDPFAELAANAVICVGGICGNCDQDVCAAPECSLFYSKRFCARCVHGSSNGEEPRSLSRWFPKELSPQIGMLSRQNQSQFTES